MKHDISWSFSPKNMKHGNQSTSNQPFQQSTLSLLKQTLDGFAFRLVTPQGYFDYETNNKIKYIHRIVIDLFVGKCMHVIQEECWCHKNTAWKKMGRTPFLPPGVPVTFLDPSTLQNQQHQQMSQTIVPQNPSSGCHFFSKKTLFVFFSKKSGNQSR